MSSPNELTKLGDRREVRRAVAAQVHERHVLLTRPLDFRAA
jgi:hypothetical protein